MCQKMVSNDCLLALPDELLGAVFSLLKGDAASQRSLLHTCKSLYFSPACSRKVSRKQVNFLQIYLHKGVADRRKVANQLASVPPGSSIHILQIKGCDDGSLLPSLPLGLLQHLSCPRNLDLGKITHIVLQGTQRNYRDMPYIKGDDAIHAACSLRAAFPCIPRLELQLGADPTFFDSLADVGTHVSALQLKGLTIWDGLHMRAISRLPLQSFSIITSEIGDVSGYANLASMHATLQRLELDALEGAGDAASTTQSGLPHALRHLTRLEELYVPTVWPGLQLSTLQLPALKGLSCKKLDCCVLEDLFSTMPSLTSLKVDRLCLDAQSPSSAVQCAALAQRVILEFGNSKCILEVKPGGHNERSPAACSALFGALEPLQTAAALPSNVELAYIHFQPGEAHMLMRFYLKEVRKVALKSCVLSPSSLAECATSCPDLDKIGLSSSYDAAYILVAAAAALGQNKAILICLDTQCVYNARPYGSYANSCSSLVEKWNCIAAGLGDTEGMVRLNSLWLPFF